MFDPDCEQQLCETHQQALVSAEHGVAEGWARTVVTGLKACVQMSRASHYLQNIHTSCGLLLKDLILLGPYGEDLNRATVIPTRVCSGCQLGTADNEGSLV